MQVATTMASGSRALAEKRAIVLRLTSIKELAGIDMLCSDKTDFLAQILKTKGIPENEAETLGKSSG